MPNFTPSQESEPPIPVAEAQKRALDCVADFGVEEIPITEAAGRVLREDVVADWDVPGADNSAMDGYAVVASDLRGATADNPVRLDVTGDVPAGSVSETPVSAGSASRIMTGAAIPTGADTVVQVEVTDGGDNVVSVYRELSPGTNVRRRGEDIRKGDVVLSSGRMIRSGEVGVLATVGRATVKTGRRPIVAILSTGSEIVDLGERPGPGKVTNSNAYALATLVHECGGEPRVMGIVPDSREGTVAALAGALEASDVVLTSGGVSVGAYDFVKDAVNEIGAETRFWRVAMKPGKPILLALHAGRPIFGLPGNPVSSMVGFHLFVAPVLRKGMGLVAGCLPPTVRARATLSMTAKGDRPTFLRVRVRAVEGELTAEPMKVQGSGVTTSMVGANGLAIVPAGTSSIDEGVSVEVLLIGPIESA